MNIMFATCERRRALGFLKKLYPSYEVEDTPECAGPLLDAVEQDLMRVCDPDYHTGMVIPGNKFDESQREQLAEIAKTFHESLIGESV